MKRGTIAVVARRGLYEGKLVDRIVTIGRDNVGDVIGTLDPTSSAALDRALALFLGLL